MRGRMIGSAVGLLLVLSGCSREDRDLVSYLRINQSAISGGDTIALQSGAPDTIFSWSVVYTAPTSDYWMEVLLADAENNEQVLFRQTCDKRLPERYGCGASAHQVCSPGPNSLYCNGQQIGINQSYDRLLFKGCVTDAYERPVCGIEEYPVTLTGLALSDLPEPPSPPVTPDIPGDGNPPSPDHGDRPDQGEEPAPPNDEDNEPDKGPGGGSGDNPGDGPASEDPGDKPDDGPGEKPGEDAPGSGEDNDPWWRWDGFPWLDHLFDGIEVPPSVPVI